MPDARLHPVGQGTNESVIIFEWNVPFVFHSLLCRAELLTLRNELVAGSRFQNNGPRHSMVIWFGSGG